MVLHRSTGEIEHRAFRDLPDYLRPGDLLATNNTRVLPARLIGKKETGGKIEVLLVPSWNGMKDRWKILCKDSGKLKRGTRIQFWENICGEVKEVENGKGEICFSVQGDVRTVLRQIGHTPLPPYIKREDEPLDRDRYQTIFAKTDGSIAAPTAGLHFTRPMVRSLRNLGIHMASITLHVGTGTFTPVKVNDVEDHRMEQEWVEIPEETAKKIEWVKSQAGRILSVGTTTTRALESFSNEDGTVRPGKGMTGLFIYPPYPFRVIDGLITNFHLPRSTLILLVSAFAGKDLLLKAYQEAIAMKYQFYSYGDAMLIL
jgi:S-adenosylmethionine:tRNA ribosyltransferase-isomerase